MSIASTNHDISRKDIIIDTSHHDEDSEFWLDRDPPFFRETQESAAGTTYSPTFQHAAPTLGLTSGSSKGKSNTFKTGRKILAKIFNKASSPSPPAKPTSSYKKFGITKLVS